MVSTNSSCEEKQEKNFKNNKSYNKQTKIEKTKQPSRVVWMNSSTILVCASVGGGGTDRDEREVLREAEGSPGLHKSLVPFPLLQSPMTHPSLPHL